MPDLLCVAVLRRVSTAVGALAPIGRHIRVRKSRTHQRLKSQEFPSPCVNYDT
jgi:hypothetical protein